MAARGVDALTDRELLSLLTEDEQSAEALLAAQQQAGQTAAQGDAKEALRSVGARWDSLTAQERQSLVRACVEKIVLRNDKIEIFYTIDSAERSASQAG